LWDINKNLEAILKRLDRLIALAEISNRGQIEELKDKVLSSESRQDIYALCDGKTSVGQIAKILRKTIYNVSSQLIGLDRAGLVLVTRKGKEKYYIKKFEL